MWSVMRPAMRRRGLATAAARALATRQRGLCTAGSSPLAGIRARAADAWEDALDAEWVDEPDIGLMTEGISQIVDDYRPLYSAEDVAGGGEAKVRTLVISRRDCDAACCGCARRSARTLVGY